MNWNKLEKKYDSTRMKENIESQGRSIQLTIKNEIEKIKNVAKRVRGCRNFIFSGCGDKHIVALLSKFIWNHISDRHLDVIQSKILAKYPPKNLNKNTCVAFISQSGMTTDTLEACKLAIERNASVVAITNLKEKKAGSLIELCENYKKGFVLRTHTEIYPELPLPSTATFHTSLTVLNLFSLLLNNADDKFFDLQVNHIPKIVDYLSRNEKVKEVCRKNVLKLKNYDNFYVVGDGPRYLIAKKHAKIMMMEGVKTNACDVESEEFIHSLIETLEGKINPLILLKPLDSWGKAKENYLLIKNMWPKNKIVEIDPFEFLTDELAIFTDIEGDLLSPFVYAVLSEWQSYYLAILKRIDPGKAKLVKKVRNEEELKNFLM